MERQGRYMCMHTPVGELVGEVAVQFVHDQDGDQLDASSGDGYNDVTNGRSEGEPIDPGVDQPGHGKSIEDDTEYNANHCTHLWGQRSDQWYHTQCSPQTDFQAHKRAVMVTKNYRKRAKMGLTWPGIKQ